MEREWYKDMFLTSGGCGEIWLYRKKKSGECLAVKNMKAVEDAAKLHDKALQWKKECEMMLTLNHPNIIRAFEVPADIVQITASPFSLLAMEYCPDGDLRKVLKKPENIYGLSEPEIRAIIRDISCAIEYIHSRSIVHRDIKPDNVLLSRTTDSPSTIVYKLCDLGFAKDQSQAAVCQTQLGTVFYVAPEVLFREQSSASYNYKADYWSFGTLVFECITGRRPFFHSNNSDQWLRRDFYLLKEKRSVDIYAYFSSDDSKSHQFSENLPATTRLNNSTLRAYLEQWLRLMLRWDPEKRGGPKDSTTGRLQCFRLLEQIISVKFVRFFSLATNETSVYPIHSSSAALCPSMTMRDMMKMMEKEKHTNLPLTSIDIVTASGHVIDPNESIASFTQPCDGEDENVLYLYDKTRPWSPCSLNQLPGLLQHLLNGTTTAKQKENHRLICTFLIYYISEQIRCFRRLRHAAKLSHVTLLMTKEAVDNARAVTEAKYKCFETKKNFETECLKTDIDEAKHHESLCDEMLDADGKAWKLPDECLLLCQSMSEFRTDCQFLNAKFIQLRSLPNEVDGLFSTLLELHMTATKLLEKLKPAAEPDKCGAEQEAEMSSNESCYDAMKLCLDKFVTADRKLLQCLNSHCREAQQSGQTMTNCISRSSAMQQKFAEVEAELKTLQQMRQRDIWQLLHRWSLKVVEQNSLPVSSNDDDDDDDVDHNDDVHWSRQPSSTLIAELLQTQAQLDNATLDVQEYTTSPASLDWSFLDATDAS